MQQCDCIQEPPNLCHLLNLHACVWDFGKALAMQHQPIVCHPEHKNVPLAAVCCITNSATTPKTLLLPMPIDESGVLAHNIAINHLLPCGSNACCTQKLVLPLLQQNMDDSWQMILCSGWHSIGQHCIAWVSARKFEEGKWSQAQWAVCLANWFVVCFGFSQLVFQFFHCFGFGVGCVAVSVLWVSMRGRSIQRNIAIDHLFLQAQAI